MSRSLRFARTIDRLTDFVGRTVSWFALAMILIGAYNTIVRYLGRFMESNLSSNVYLELQWYLFSLLFLLGAAYTLRRNAHVRVDVVYGRMRPRTQAWIDLLGGAIFLVPFCVFGLWISWPTVLNSWTVREVSPDPGGLPRYPIKAVILLAFALLLLQGLAEIFRRIAYLRGENTEDEHVEIRI